MSYGMQYSGGGPASKPGLLRADVALETIFRPWIPGDRILAIRARRKAQEEDTTDDSLIRWGRPSEYGSPTQTKEESRSGVRIVNSNPKKDPDANKPPRVYTEIERETETVRVTNPSDATQYVDVQRIKSILFRGPDGIDVRFNLNPPPGTPVP
jgi:hypothetical protein